MYNSKSKLANRFPYPNTYTQKQCFHCLGTHPLSLFCRGVGGGWGGGGGRGMVEFGFLLSFFQFQPLHHLAQIKIYSLLCFVFVQIIQALPVTVFVQIIQALPVTVFVQIIQALPVTVFEQIIQALPVTVCADHPSTTCNCLCADHPSTTCNCL